MPSSPGPAPPSQPSVSTSTEVAGQKCPGPVPTDFVNYVHQAQSLSNSRKLKALQDHFKPNKLYFFPTRTEHGKKHAFRFDWLEKHNWLVYSPAQDGAYCKVCALFGSNSCDKNASKLDKLVKSPVTFWTTAAQKFKKHELKSQVHKTATLKAENFLKVMQSQMEPIDQQLHSALASQIAENRLKLQSIVKTIVFCGRQNIALRGHHEDDLSRNPGNFKALLKFRIDSGDQVLQNHFASATVAKYTSKNIQNEIISVIANWIQKKLLRELQDGSRVFSLIADESRDCSNKEQMPLIIRYVDESNKIQEMFLAFLECEQGSSGENVASLIVSNCQSLGLNLQMCRGQGYDGASNMSGMMKGASSIIRSKFPKALYFHCASHKLNLCIAHSCQLTSITNMMDVITSLANFFNYSPKRQKCFERHVSTMCDETAKSKLLPLCRTRWVERLNALEVTIDLFQVVVETLADMEKNSEKQWNRDTATQASSLLKCFDFDFLINLVIVQRILAYTSSITSRLQSRGLDILRAYQEIALVIRTLELIRTKVDEYHHDCFVFAKELAVKVDVEIRKPRTCQRQRFRQNAIVAEQRNPEQVVEDYFRINVTIPFLDEVVGNMKTRFEDGQASVVKGAMLIPACVLTEPDWKSQIDPCVQMYIDDLPSRHTLNAELDLWEQKWSDIWQERWKILQQEHVQATGEQLVVTHSELKTLKQKGVPSSIATTLAEVTPTLFPNIYCLLSTLAVLPVTSCEAERCISCLRRLKTYLRSSMNQDRLTGLALLHVHNYIPIDIDQVIEEFALMHPRRMKLANILSN